MTPNWKHEYLFCRATLTVEEAGKLLGISRSLAYEGIHLGLIPSIKIGGRYLVPTEELAAMLGVSTDEDWA